MFEKVVLRRSAAGESISAGQLAEALLFYQNVHLVLDVGSFSNLLGQIGPGALLSVLQRPDCTAVFCKDQVGTHTESFGALKAHSFVAFTLDGHEEVGKFRSHKDRLVFLLNRAGVPIDRAKRYAREFLQIAPVRELAGNDFVKGGIKKAADQDLSDSAFLNDAVNAVLSVTPGATAVGQALQFKIVPGEGRFFVFCNIEFDEINRLRKALDPSLGDLTEASLLTCILDARSDLSLASHYGGDFLTSEYSSAIIALRYGEILRRAGLNREEQEDFRNILLSDYPSVSEVVNSGQRTFGEFLHLLDKASRFKDWLRSASVDEGLLKEYTSAISKESWIEKAPAKFARYLATTGLGEVDPISGAVAGLADSFLIEKLFRGWRPNHFVFKRLGPFLDADR